MYIHYKLALLRPIFVAGIIGTIFFAVWPPLALLPILVLIKDQLARLAEYKASGKYKTLKPSLYKSSYCSRGVAVARYGDIAVMVFRAMGYKWYHILPDGAPTVFLKREFWRDVFNPKFS